MPSPTEITVAQLARLIGTPRCPSIVDVRTPEDFADDPRLIPGSLRHAFQNVQTFQPKEPDQAIIVSCQKGLKLSQGFAALLRIRGLAARTLEGGYLAWQDAGLPMVPAKSIPASDPEKYAGPGSLWVTRHRPKIDRIACPWLIRRFVDPSAQFLFVAPSEVFAVAERFGATPFDVEDCHFSHRGEACTFDTMLGEFNLTSQPLHRLAIIVRGADTNRHDLAPEAAGLLAVSLGLSRMYRDDLAQMEAGMLVYDALYRWARDATAEGHDWPSASGPV